MKMPRAIRGFNLCHHIDAALSPKHRRGLNSRSAQFPAFVVLHASMIDSGEFGRSGLRITSRPPLIALSIFQHGLQGGGNDVFLRFGLFNHTFLTKSLALSF